MPDYLKQRKEMVKRYFRAGYIKTNTMAEAVLKVKREEFMDNQHRDYAYYDQPFSIPGDGRQTISAPYMYPAVYEPLKIRKGHRFLEVGAGSGYGAAIARELVGENGLVVTIEINRKTFEFAKRNLERTGYNDVIVLLGDGSLGYPDKAPYDIVSITAATPKIPKPIIEQLASPGQIVAPVGTPYYSGQDLILLEKTDIGTINKKKLMKVVYVPLIGEYGWKDRDGT